MCGRYRVSRRKQLVEEYFDTAARDDDWSPRFNIAPTHPIPVIRQHPKKPVTQDSGWQQSIFWLIKDVVLLRMSEFVTNVAWPD
jgi:putative SOS response-associated peptidase YedK